MWLFSFYVERWVIHRVNVTVDCVDWVLVWRWVRVFGARREWLVLKREMPYIHITFRF